MSSDEVQMSNSQLRPILGVRLNKNYSNTVVSFKTFETMNTSGNRYSDFYVYLNPIVSGTFSYSLSAGAVEYAKGPGSGTTMSGGILLYTGHVPKDLHSGQLDFSKKFSSLGIGISGRPDEYVVGIKTYGGTGDFVASLNMLERG